MVECQNVLVSSVSALCVNKLQSVVSSVTEITKYYKHMGLLCSPFYLWIAVWLNINSPFGGNMNSSENFDLYEFLDRYVEDDYE